MSSNSMITAADFHAGRRFVETRYGRIAYFERGTGPVALFIHGVPLNGFHWRHVINAVSDLRRCVALDLMGLGYTQVGPAQDLSFTTQAAMVAEFLDGLGIDQQLDVVANDSGVAVAQIFATTNPSRIRSLTVTNGDIHDGWPPVEVAPYVDAARAGTLVDLFGAFADDLSLARSPEGMAVVYARPDRLDTETLKTYLNPIRSSTQRRNDFNRYWLSFDPAKTVCIEPQLRNLEAPALIVWGLADIFFHVKWAYWLYGTLPNAMPVIEVPGAKLFFPEDMPEALVTPLREFWGDSA